MNRIFLIKFVRIKTFKEGKQMAFTIDIDEEKWR